ncbi:MULTISPECIES: sensor histidine kinase [Amycolatopsis]|uniref:histidine kinase n=1 Tax=Amycolatopsis thermalba TaxID=944492 RepID=A0ABY4NQL0_9PSEU|nr:MULTISPECIES: histidine kinase [Amycolatopsis]OXM74263.1 histidine kinase [Amycolatopsis sp. KNN50.9b]UQS22009.1 histidine kinase [Amycolatopsis thermalba]
MDTTTGSSRRMKLELGWPVPVLGAVCAMLAAMPAGTVLATTSTLVVLLVALGIAMHRARRPKVTVAASVAAASSSLVATFGSGDVVDQSLSSWLLMESALLLCVLVQAVRQTRGPGTLLSAGAVTSAVVLAPLRLASSPRASPGMASASEWCFGWGLLAACALAVGMYLRFLDEVREESIRAARREQRVRLASDLHDWLGHEVTGLVLEAQAARINDREPVEVRRALERIEGAGVRVLDSIDRALCWLRADDGAAGMVDWERQATMADIPALVNRFGALGSVRVELDLDDQVRDVRPEIARTVHRIVLEALTNVRRHAPAARQVSVAVRRNGAHVIVRVVNDGVRRQGLLKRARGGGSGLRGLAERAIALGGTSWAGPMGQAGWAVHAVLPVVS